MTTNHPVIGWESETPVPHGHRFNDYLHVQNGRLHMKNLDLVSLFTENSPAGQYLPSPLEIVYLPIIRQKIDFMNQVFKDVIAETGYEGKFHYTYASKANAAEEVIRTTLGAGANHEMSSTVDVDIAKIMIRRGLLTPDRIIVCNGFKTAGSQYAANILQLHQQHEKIIPVIEDLGEMSPFISSGHQL